MSGWPKASSGSAAGVAEVTDGTLVATGNVKVVGGAGLTPIVTPGANGTLTLTEVAPYVLGPSGDVTGATDATNIQAAVNSHSNVLLTAGTFYVSTPISLPSGTILSGTGMGQIYNTTANNTVIQPISCNAFNIPNANQQGVLQDLQILGSSALSFDAVHCTDSGIGFLQFEWSFLRVFVQGFTSGRGLYFGTNLGNIYVRECMFYNNATGAYVAGSDAVFDTCLFVVNLNYGVIDYGAITTICNCSMGSNGINAIIRPTGASNSGGMYYGNGINNNGAAGLSIVTGQVTVFGNSFRSNSANSAGTYPHIEVGASASDCTINDNFFVGSGTAYDVQLDSGVTVIGTGNALGQSVGGFTNAPTGWSFGGGAYSGGALGYVNYVSGSVNYPITTTTPGTAVDGTNLSLAGIIAPPSGIVEVTVSAFCVFGSITLYGSSFSLVTHGSTTQVTAPIGVGGDAAGGNQSRPFMRLLVTGLTPGASYHWDLAAWIGNAATSLTIYAGTAQGPVTMVARAI